jgi:hypothetical protein
MREEVTSQRPTYQVNGSLMSDTFSEPMFECFPKVNRVETSVNVA